MSLTPSVKQYVNEKIGNLGKYIVATDAKVELDRDKHHKSGQVFRAEVMLLVGGKLMRAETTGEDIYSAIDLVIPKIKEQIGKFKDKKMTLVRRGARSAKRKR